jgi:quercetin 2,3-dioxygenase
MPVSPHATEPERRNFAPVKLSRRSALLGSAALLGCKASKETPMPASIIRSRKLAELPSTELPWLKLRDHFIATVGPRAGDGTRMGPLLVLADATFEPHSRFPLHPHRDMEILSLVLEGTLSHHGDGEHGAALRPREAQLISARDGIVHAEGNDTDAQTHMLQIWFEPKERGGAPDYFRRQLAPRVDGAKQLLAGDAQMPLRCDAKVWWVDLPANTPTALELGAGRKGYVLALDGAVTVGAAALAVGEGAELQSGTASVQATRPTAVLWIDVGA